MKGGAARSTRSNRLRNLVHRLFTGHKGFQLKGSSRMFKIQKNAKGQMQSNAKDLWLASATLSQRLTGIPFNWHKWTSKECTKSLQGRDMKETLWRRMSPHHTLPMLAICRTTKRSKVTCSRTSGRCTLTATWHPKKSRTIQHMLGNMSNVLSNEPIYFISININIYDTI